MFTVKHVEYDGHESLRETPFVWCSPKQTPEGKPLPQEVFAYVDGVTEPITFGTGDVFVMNEAGKTVSIYHLGYPS